MSTASAFVPVLSTSAAPRVAGTAVTATLLLGSSSSLDPATIQAVVMATLAAMERVWSRKWKKTLPN